MTGSHHHDHPETFDWFKVLDIAVWVAVALIVVMSVEWLIGHVIRESIAKGASRHLAKVSGPENPDA